MNYTTNASANGTGSTPLANLSLLNNALSANGIINTATYNTLNPVATAKLVLNGNDRFAERRGNYFNLIQPYQHHTNIPANAGINVYSFGLKPEEHQPSGTLNMSRIDTAVLNVSYDSDYVASATAANLNLYTYAINYNVLRILSGMGGLAYSN